MKNNSRALLALLVLALGITAVAKEKLKPWTQWTIKDAEKVLNDSAWGQTQTDTNTSEMTWSTAPRAIEGQGAFNQATGVNYRIRFLTAKPIRLALARLAELDPGKNTPAQIKQARDFAERKFEDTIVLAVGWDGKDGRYTGSVFQAFSSAITSTLKNNTYLEFKGGKKIFLLEYQPPGGDGLGGKFIFPRLVDGVPIIDPKGGEVRFWAEFPKLAGNNLPITLNMRFKIADFMYEGVLEY